MRKNTKQSRWKRFVAATGAGVIATAVVVTTIANKTLESEAAETFLGIEQIKSEVAESGEPYKILEIVPDRDAAEIGYLVGGYEPVLSEWSDTENRWISWQEQLIEIEDPADRAQFIEDKKDALEAYYLDEGITGAYPVIAYADPYEESLVEAEGYETITAPGLKQTGIFDPTYTTGDEPVFGGAYQVDFTTAGAVAVVDETNGKNYYSVEKYWDLYHMTDDELQQLSMDTMIYTRTTNGSIVTYTPYMTLMEYQASITSEEDAAPMMMQNRNENSSTENDGDTTEDGDTTTTDTPATGDGTTTDTPTTGDGTQTPTTGDGSQTPTTGDGTQTPTTGDGTQTPTTGDGTQTPTTGDGTQTPTTGDGSQTPTTPTTGDGSQTPTTGEVGS